MKKSEIRAFRKVLRRFERVMVLLLKDTSYCCGVTLAQCHVLLAIEEQGRTTTGELSGVMDLDKSTLSRTLDGLVASGLVERKPNPSDRRYFLLGLTGRGKETCKRINRDNDKYFRDILKAVPAGEQEKVIHNFELLVQAFAKQVRPGKGEACCSGSGKRKRSRDG